MKTTTGEKIKHYRKTSGLSLRGLGKLAHVSHSFISDIEQGRSTPSLTTLNALAKALKIPASCLLENNTSNSFGVFSVKEPSATYLPSGAIPVGKMVKVPILGEIRAGEPMFAEEHVLGYEEMPIDELNGSKHFYLVVKGDSMTGSNIYPGYKVLVRQQEYVENNEIAVVLVNSEEATLKRVKYLNDNVLLYPDNPAYEAQVYKQDEVQILGVVVEVKFKP